MRVIVYDRTCIGRGGSLTPAWAVGARCYRAIGRSDAEVGVTSWDDALRWLAGSRDPIREVQYWGHGTWGRARVDRDVLDANALRAGHRLRARLEAVRERLEPGALVWFRTCETFGARRGLDFAERLADFLGARVAGHTRRIGFHQSGLHGLVPGVRATWSPAEGLARGTPDEPRRSKPSLPWAPRTITGLTGDVPAAWFSS